MSSDDDDWPQSLFVQWLCWVRRRRMKPVWAWKYLPSKWHTGGRGGRWRRCWQPCCFGRHDFSLPQRFSVSRLQGLRLMFIAAPQGAVTSEGLSGGDLQVEGFQVYFQGVPEALLLSSNWALQSSCFGRWSSGRFAFLSCPSNLSLLEKSVHARNTSLCEDFQIRWPVLPPDLRECMQAAHVKAVELSGASAAHCPCFRSIQEDGEHNVTVSTRIFVVFLFRRLQRNTKLL